MPRDSHMHTMFVGPVRQAHIKDQRSTVYTVAILQFGGGELSLQYPSAKEAAAMRSQLLSSANAHALPHKTFDVLRREFERIASVTGKEARVQPPPDFPPEHETTTIS